MANYSERDIHTATVIRLQVAHNALDHAIPAINEAVADLPDIAKHLTAIGESGFAANVSEILEKLRETLPLVRAALAIARGAGTDVPEELRGRLTDDTAMLTRLLSISTARG